MRHDLVAIILLASATAHAQRPRPATAWRSAPNQPTRIELTAVQHAAAPAIRQCIGPHGAWPRIDVVFDTSGRAFWTNVDRSTNNREHCLSVALHNAMRLQPFSAIAMVRVRFPLQGTHW